MSENFDDLAGMIKTDKSVTIEEIDEVISKAVVERFNNAVDSFKFSWQEVMHGNYYPVETLWDDFDK